jgi:hypothetical protein
MTRIVALPTVLLLLFAGLCGAQDRYRPVLVSIRPGIDIPLPPDQRLFEPGGGVGIDVSYVFPFYHPFSAGIGITYRAGPMEHADLGHLGSLSLLSVEAAAELRLTFWKRIDLYLAAAGGYFYSFRNGDPSQWATNLTWSGRIGAGFRSTPSLSLGIQGEYRRYESLYHLIGIGAGVDLRLGSAP